MKKFEKNRHLFLIYLFSALVQLGYFYPSLNANEIDYYEPEKYFTQLTPHPGPIAPKVQSDSNGNAASYSFGVHTYSANGELAQIDSASTSSLRTDIPNAANNPSISNESSPRVDSEPVTIPENQVQLAPKNEPIPTDTPSGIPSPSASVTPQPVNQPAPAIPSQPPANAQPAPITNQPISVGPINFNNVSIIEYIRFISRVSNKNFVFEDEDLQFTVTIISEEPTSVENLMTALLQELKIRDLSLIEQGNTLIIHRNPRIRAPGHIVVDVDSFNASRSEIITRVFRLNTLDPTKATEIIKPLLSDDALVEVLRDTNNLIITDLVENVSKISQLINSLDAPNSGVTVGQYVVRSGFVDSLVDLASRILFPIAQGNPFVLVPHAPSNSIYIVSNSFIVEKALAILQNLDNNEGKTKIFSLDQLQPTGYNPETGAFSTKENQAASQSPLLPNLPPEFPAGSIGKGPSVYNETSEFLPGGISAASRYARELPAGHIERTVFFIYKLKYRRGDQIDVSLRKIALSLMTTGIANIDLVSAINSVQWIESSNSLIFTGTVPALEKIKDLILEVDTPLHQVYIEMLILDTTLDDSLHYGVDWGVLWGGGNTSGGETFLTPPRGTRVLDSLTPNVNVVPNAKGILGGEGFNLGIIGKHLTHNGLHFSTISALVQALHNNSKAHIILNPRIITEDNVTAEVFVGETDRYKTQSISNDQGRVITNNFQFIDVGTTLRVTPLIGNNGIITLDVIEEFTSPAPQANVTSAATDQTDVNLVTVLHKNRSTTRLHVPNGFFVVMSGIIHERESRFKNEIPCLGMIPLIGGAGKFKRMEDRKRNLMIFIRPVIVDTESELECITKRQQDVYRDKCKMRRDWNYEIDEALDFFNLVPTDPDEISCQLK
jgi:type III secretion protein C